MIAPLQDLMDTTFRRQRRMQTAIRLAICWGVIAVVGLIVLASARRGAVSSAWIFVLGILTVLATVIILSRQRRKQPDWHDIARRIEKQYPELNGVLLTAMQQQPADNGPLNYLQERIVREAIVHSYAHDWSATVPLGRALGAQLGAFVALLVLVWVMVGLRPRIQPASIYGNGWTENGVTVTPGDTSIERGERLVVVASFAGSIPVTVDLVTSTAVEKSNRIALVKSLSDPVFGGSVSEVMTDLVYRVEYGDKQTREFTVKVFEYPRLERSDADITYPDYTGLKPKHIENTRRLSAVEGSTGKLTLQLNKPVVRAQLVAADIAPIPLLVDSNTPTATLENFVFQTNRTYQLQLIDDEGRTNKVSAQFVMDALKNREPEMKIASPRGDTRPSALEEVTFEGTVWDDFGVKAYGLAYTAAGGETKFIELGKDIPANEKRTFKHVLRLEDLGAKPDQLISWFLWAEDIGADGQERRTAADMYFAEVRPFDEVFRQGQAGGGGEGGGGGGGGGGNQQTKLAELQKQIINATWKLQREQARKSPAPPTKPEPTRKSSAIDTREERAAANVRPPVVRTVFGQRAEEKAPAPSESSLDRVRERVSKITKTNSVASASQFAEDLKVVRDAVNDAIEQVQTTRQQQTNPRNVATWDELLKEMEKTKTALDKAADAPESLTAALAAEQAAFQVLLKLQQREYRITREQNRSQSGQSGRNQQMQRQLQQLDLTKEENRYENERQAQPPQSAERQEQLQIMNRLSELAKRQQDLNEKLKELQTALQEAQTEKEREEIRRQLKRLQEEEQRMLADVDELQQRLNQSENQAQMSEQRQQLDQTRQDMQRASEATQQGSVSQALASGTRAERQLQDMRENLRKQNSSQLAEDLKQLRTDARETERRQEELRKQMDSLSGRGGKSLDDSPDRQKALEQLAQQAQRVTNLVERATQLSQQTETAEPLASRELYDSIRKFSQDDANSVRKFQDELIQHGLVQTELYQRLSRMEKEDGAKAVGVATEMLRQGLLSQAQQANDRAGSALNDLKQGIERAAEKVVGDDTEALRLAQQQLEQLTKQLEREVAQGQGAGGTNANNGTNGVGAAQSASQASQSARNGEQQRQGDGQSGQSETAQAGREGQPQSQGETGQQAKGQGQQPGNNPSEQAQQESGQGQSGQSQQEEQQLAQGQGNQPGGQGAEQNQRGNRNDRGNRDGNRQGGSLRNGNTDGGSRGSLPAGFDQFFDTGRGGRSEGPIITGENYVPWSDRLREVEELVENPTLQNQLATARERARLARQEFKRNGAVPDWKTLQATVVKPLVEVRNQLAEEIARRGSRENLVPIDRDPVPNRYSELVRKYYEELGKDK